MSKYSVSHQGGPAYEQARDTRGLHVHVDASEADSIGVHVERVDDEGKRDLVGTCRQDIEAPSVIVAEGVAVRVGAQLAATTRRDEEHLFLYTDSREVVDAMYGKGGRAKASLRPVIRDIIEALPSPAQYAVILCDSGVNLAHSVARGSHEDG